MARIRFDGEFEDEILVLYDTPFLKVNKELYEAIKAFLSKHNALITGYYFITFKEVNSKNTLDAIISTPSKLILKLSDQKIKFLLPLELYNVKAEKLETILKLHNALKDFDY